MGVSPCPQHILCHVLTGFSTAELSAGVICTCLPLLPALRLTRQNDKSPGTDSRSRYLRTLTRQRTMNTTDQDPLAREYLELREDPYSVEALPPAVVTDIEVGHGTQSMDSVGREAEAMGKPATLKTIVIKQTHGVGR